MGAAFLRALFLLGLLYSHVQSQSTDWWYTSSSPPPTCGEDFYLQDFYASGRFTSPNYPSNYPDSADCIWTIRVSVGYKVAVRLPPGYSMESCCDYVEFRDGPYSNSPLLAKLTGTSSSPRVVTSSSDNIWVRFHTDESVTDKGFEASFYYAEHQTTEGTTTPTTGPEQPTTEQPTTEQPTTEQPTTTTLQSQSTGWWYTSPSPPCDQDFYLEDFYASGRFTSPNYPSHYPVSVDCIWTIRVSVGYKVAVRLPMGYYMENGYDFLELRDGPYSYSPLLARLTGTSSATRVVTASSENIWVRFHSDGIVTAMGFEAEFYYAEHQTTEGTTIPSDPTTEPEQPTTEQPTTEQPTTEQSTTEQPTTEQPTTTTLQSQSTNWWNTSPPPPCDEDFYLEDFYASGRFTSPNYPSHYPVSVDCIWTIRVSVGYKVAVRLPVGYYIEYGYDFLELRDGPYSYSPLLAWLTGTSSSTRVVTSSSENIWVRFHSDAIVTDKGFEASFYYAERNTTEGTTPSDPTTEQPTTTTLQPQTSDWNPPTSFTDPTSPPSPTCGEDFYSEYGRFSSPNYPSNYSDSVNCIWTIRVSDGQKVSVSLPYGYSTEIGYDFLEFRDGLTSDSPLLAKISGHSPSPQVFTASLNTIWVRFYTDGSITRKGFEALFYAETTGTTPHTTNEPSKTTTKIPTPPPVVNPGIVINNNNNMFVNFLDMFKLQAWLPDLKAQMGNMSALGSP